MSWKNQHNSIKVIYLESGVDGEAASTWVHASHILAVVDVLLGELVLAVPVAIVDMLSDDRVRPHRPVLVHLRHVHVV